MRAAEEKENRGEKEKEEEGKGENAGLVRRMGGRDDAEESERESGHRLEGERPAHTRSPHDEVQENREGKGCESACTRRRKRWTESTLEKRRESQRKREREKERRERVA